jgi:o-succinylbenzoate synthase
MVYRFSCRPYRRPFLRPLVTGHGVWSVREGIILRLTDPLGRCYWSEIAPLPQFGSETFELAWDFCVALPPDLLAIPSVPNNLPATQFAFSALLDYGENAAQERHGDDPQWSALLPTGTAVLESWAALWQAGHRTFKWKIGVSDLATELGLLENLLGVLPSEARLRLDANGSLSINQAHAYLKYCATQPRIEFVEQPVVNLDTMMVLADQYPTPLAIDELVSNLTRLEDCYERGWRGIYVIKPAIAGDLQRLKEFVVDRQLDVVYSSSLETHIGQNIIRRWSADQKQRAAGMGMSSWFAPDDEDFKNSESMWYSAAGIHLG